MSTLDLILRCAQVPSFSTYEERLHPLIQRLVAECPGATCEKVNFNNLLVTVPGRSDRPAVALAAHLDKINHFGEQHPDVLPARIEGGKIIGPMDDTAGLGLCLSLMQQACHRQFPPLLLLFSEVEESFGLKWHPEWLKRHGEGIYAGMGAERLTHHLLRTGRIPSAVITLDTTPLFRGKPGLALYRAPWDIEEFVPRPELKYATASLADRILALDPEILIANNTNDYATYGKEFHTLSPQVVPCVALEPSIQPYHQQNEEVYVQDIERLEALLCQLLETWPASFLTNGHHPR